MVLADGCNWGEKPKEAAKIATKQMVEHMKTHGGSIKNTMQAGEVLLHGFMTAHKTILDYNQTRKGRPANTTLLAAVILPLAKPITQRNTEFHNVCVSCSVGDCTIVQFDSDLNLFRKLFVDRGGRQQPSNASDSGGFLGPSKSQAPDLRNLALDFCLLRENDCVIIMSDGVTDNLDPEFQGFLPNEIPSSSISSPSSWKDLEVSSDLKNGYLVYLLPKLISLYGSHPLRSPFPMKPQEVCFGCNLPDDDSVTTELLYSLLNSMEPCSMQHVNPLSIVNSVIRFSKHLTSPLRNFYNTNPNPTSANTTFSFIFLFLFLNSFS